MQHMFIERRLYEPSVVLGAGCWEHSDDSSLVSVELWLTLACSSWKGRTHGGGLWAGLGQVVA